METGFFRSKLLAVWVLVGMTFVAAEIGLRIRARYKYGGSRASYLVTKSNDGDQGTGLQANFSRSGSWGTLSINEYGFRGKSITKEPQPGVFRVICLGSSPVFGGQMNDELLFTAVLEDELNQHFGQREIEVINAGVPGMSVERLNTKLDSHIKQFKPDVVLIYAVVNDIGHVMRSYGRFRSSGTPEAPPHFLSQWRKGHSVLYNRLWNDTKKLRPQSAKVRFCTFPEEGQAYFEDGYRQLVRNCKASGITPVLITQSHSFRREQSLQQQHRLLNGTLWGLGLPEAFIAHDALNGAVRTIAEQEQVALLDMEDRVPGDPKYFHDTIHFTAEGHRVLGEAMADELCSQEILTPVVAKRAKEEATVRR